MTARAATKRDLAPDLSSLRSTARVAFELAVATHDRARSPHALECAIYLCAVLKALGVFVIAEDVAEGVRPWATSGGPCCAAEDLRGHLPGLAAPLRLDVQRAVDALDRLAVGLASREPALAMPSFEHARAPR